jgi:hexosaminidase
VMSWRGTKGGIAAAKQGHYIVMSPTEYCYFDYYQGNGDEPLAIGGYLPLEKVYSFEPVPAELSAAEQKLILGAQGNLWTEYIPNGSYAEYMVLPRMCALAEIVWSDKDAKNWDDFQARLSVHYLRLDALNVNYRLPAIGGFDAENVFIDSTVVTLTKPRADFDLFYSLDGTQPTRESMHFVQPFKIKENCTLMAQAFAGKQARGLVKTGIFKKQLPLQAIQVDQPQPGIFYSYKEGHFMSVKELAGASDLRTGIMQDIELPADRADDYFGMSYSGFIQAPETGVYTFYLTSDDGSQLFLNDISLILNDGVHSQRAMKAQVALEQGLHPVTIYFFEASGGEFFQVDFSGPGFTKRSVPTQLLFHK